MKKLLLATALVVTNAHAMDPSAFVWIQVTVPSIISEMSREDKFVERSPIIVQSVGNGKTCEQALLNAKNTAIEKAVGVWMYGEKSVQQELYKERIVEYSGGLIKKYRVIRNDCTTVEIEAEVVSRINKIKTNSSDVSRETLERLHDKIENEKKRQAAIKEVNNRSKAIAFDIKEIEFEINKMIVVGEMSFQQKWKHDYYDLKKHAGIFTLDSFKKPIHIMVKGYNFGKEVFSAKYQLNYNLIELYHVNDSGNVAIYANKKDMIKLTFPVDSGKIMNVEKFDVTIL
jgi:hypothetical protein